MEKWFYYDAKEKKHGPYSLEALQKKARFGGVKLTTVLESVGGKRILAEELEGLLFPDWKKQLVPTLCSFLCPGMGHVMQGRAGLAILYFSLAVLSVLLTAVTIGYFTYFLVALLAALDTETWMPGMEKKTWSPAFLQKVKKPWLLSGMGIFGFILMAFMLSSCYTSYTNYYNGVAVRGNQEAARKENAANTELSKFVALAYAEQAVKKYLKHPLDAKFGWDKKTEKQGDDWLVTGTVKAPNGFGAFLTHEYRVQLTGTDKDCKMVFVEIDSQRVYP